MEGESNGSSGDHEDIPHHVVNEEEGTPADVADRGPDPEAAPRVVKHFHFNILGSNVAESVHVLRSLMHAVATHQASGTVQQQLSIQGASGTAMQSSGSPGAATQGSSFPGTPMQGSSFPGTPMQGSSFPGTPMQGSSSAGTAMQGSSFPGTPMQGSSSAGTAMQGSSFPGTPMKGSGSGTAMQGSPSHFMHGSAGSFMQGSPGPSVTTPGSARQGASGSMQGAVAGPSAFMMGSPLAAGPSFSESTPTGNQTVQLLAQALLQRKVGRPSRAQAAAQRAAMEAASMVSSGGPVATRPLCFKCKVPRSDHVLSSCGHHVCSACIAIWPIAQGHCPCGTPCNSTHLVRLNH